jgi:hypothetical protein
LPPRQLFDHGPDVAVVGDARQDEDERRDDDRERDRTGRDPASVA